MFHNKKNRSLAFFAFFLLIGFVLVYFYAIPPLININKYKSIIENRFEKRINLLMEIKNLKLSMMLTGVKVYFTGAKIKHKDNRDFLSAEKGNIEITFADLYKKQLTIKKVRINNANAVITRLNNGKFDIEQVLLFKRKKGEFYFELDNTRIIVNKYNIIAVDQFIKPSNRYVIRGESIRIKEFTPTKQIKLKINGTIVSYQKPSTIFNLFYFSKLPLNTDNLLTNGPVLKGKINNIYPDMFKSYFEKYNYLINSLDSADTNFSVNLKKSRFQMQSINADIALKSAHSNNNISLRSILNNNRLNIKTLSLTGKDFNVISNGYIENFAKKNLFWNLKISLNKVKIAGLMPFLPESFAVKNYKIDNFKADGDLKGNIKFEGTLKNPDLSGNISFKNLNISLNNYFNIINNTDGSVLFNKEQLLLSDIKGYLNNAPFEINGKYAFNKSYNLKTSFENLDIGFLYKLILDNRYIADNYFKNIKNLSGVASGELQITNALVSGYIKLSNMSLLLKDISDPVQKINGLIDVIDNKVYLQNIQGFFAGSLFKIDGEYEKNYLKAVISSNKLNISRMFVLAKTSPILEKYNQQIKNIDKLSGFADIKVNLSGRIGNNIFQNAQIHVLNTVVAYKKQSMPLIISNGKLFAQKDKIIIYSANAKVLNNTANISGQIAGINAGKIKPVLKIAFQNLNIASMNELNKYNILPAEIKRALSDFSGFKGFVAVKAEILPQGYNINLKFNRLSAFYKPNNVPLRIRKGELKLTSDVIQIKSLQSKISKSFLFVNGQVVNYRRNPDLDLIASIKLDSDDIDKYIDPYLEKPLEVSGKIPIKTSIKGNLNNFRLLAKITLDKDVSMILPKGIVLKEGHSREIIVSASGNRKSVRILNSGIVVDNDKTILSLNGYIDKLNTKNPVFTDFKILNPVPVNITLLNPFIEPDVEEPFFKSGTIKADIKLNGYLFSPDIIGSVELKEDIVPTRSLTINNAKINITQNKYILEESSINIADSDIKLKATTKKTFNLPLEIENIEIISSSLNFDKVKKAFEKTADNFIETAEISPIIIQEGKVNADEFIISNFITSNLDTKISIDKDWLVTLPNLSLNAANGEAFGKVTYNIKTQITQGDVGIKDMSANAAATTFLNIPNEVYGILEGNAQFDTKGTMKDELISNANGTANFVIKEGRLTRLGSLEYLLLAANTVTVGLANINLNSILNLIIPKKTGYFDTLDGKLTAEKGILATNNVTSKGKNLSLLLTGNMNMLTNYSDLTVLGRVSKKITGLLGPLGSISINTFVEYLPGLGFIPGTGGKGLIDLIPLINRVPLLGLGKGKHRRFAVEIKGDLYDPKSVKSFRWLD